MTKVRCLGHVSLTVLDLDTALDFYRDLLGMKLTERKEYADPNAPLREAAWLRCGSEHHAVALFEMRDAVEHEVVDSALAPVPGLHHFAFELDSFDDLSDLHRRLVANGVEVAEQSQFGPGSHVRLYCLDPDGHRVELYWELDTIGWNGEARVADPAEPVDLQNFDVEAFLARKVPS